MQVIDKYIYYHTNIYIHLSIFEKHPSVPTLIFIHGSGCHAFVYYDFLKQLSDENFNVIGIDLPGHGKSSGKRGKFTYDEIMDSISLTIDYAIENYNSQIGIIGSSLGGFLSLYACGEDERIKSAVCHNVIDLYNLPYNKKFFSNNIFKKLAGALSIILPDIYIPLNYLFSWKDVFENEMNFKKLKQDEMMVWKYTLRSLATLFIFIDKKPILPSIKTPIFILASDGDRILTEDYCRDVFNKINNPNNKFLCFENAGHMLFVEHVEKVIKLISDWFNKTLK